METELDAMAAVCDRLTGGVMFHSDHADLMSFLGLGRFAEMHEEGFLHDSRALRDMRSECIERLGRIPPQGDQRRGVTLSKLMAYSRPDLSASDRYKLATESLTAWAEWERGTAEALNEAKSLLDGVLWRRVDKLARGAEDEAVEAETLSMEAMACDMAHVYDMQR